MDPISYSKKVLDQLTTKPDLPNSHEIYKFCQPFFKAFGINYFDYARFYPDQSCHIVSSDLLYVKFFLDYQALQATRQYVVPLKILPAGKHLWQGYLGQTFINDASEGFNHALGLTVIKNHALFNELYNFSAPAGYDKILDLYLNHDYLFDTFLACFTDHFSHILKKNTNRIVFPTYDSSVSAEHSSEDLLYSKLEQALQATIKVRKNNVLVPCDGFVARLSKQEVNCLMLVAQGKSAKQIARTLAISPKTAGLHCCNLLRKTESSNRIEMLAKLNKNFLARISTAQIV